MAASMSAVQSSSFAALGLAPFSSALRMPTGVAVLHSATKLASSETARVFGAGLDTSFTRGAAEPSGKESPVFCGSSPAGGSNAFCGLSAVTGSLKPLLNVSGFLWYSCSIWTIFPSAAVSARWACCAHQSASLPALFLSPASAPEARRTETTSGLGLLLAAHISALQPLPSTASF